MKRVAVLDTKTGSLTTFDSAGEAAVYLLGRSIDRHKVFVLVKLDDAEYGQIKAVIKKAIRCLEDMHDA